MHLSHLKWYKPLIVKYRENSGKCKLKIFKLGKILYLLFSYFIYNICWQIIKTLFIHKYLPRQIEIF